MTASDNRILAVKVPYGSIPIEVNQCTLYYEHHHKVKYMALPDGNWKLIGLHSKDKPLSDDQLSTLFPGFMKVHGKIPSKQLRDTLNAWMFNNDIYTTEPDFNSATEQSEIDRIRSRTGSWAFLIAI